MEASAVNQQEALAFARNELKRSKRWRQNHKDQYDDAWRRYIDLYAGKHYDAKSGTDQLVVNMVFATKNVMAPAVAINNPKFTVQAQRDQEAPNAIIAEEVLNYLWRAHRYQGEFRLGIDDWLIAGHGWLKVGYKFVKPPESKPAETPAGGNSEDEGADEGVDDREDVPGNVESELVTSQATEYDCPFVERISIFDMFVDPDARHPKEMRWIAQRTWRAVQDVHVDERYSATQRRRVSGSSWSRWTSDDGDGRAGSQLNGGAGGEKPDSGAVQFAEIIEFYDIKRQQVMTFALDGDGKASGFLIKPEKMPYALGHPFVMLRNYEIPDHFYPMGDVQQIESLQLELNETRNQMLNYRKKFRRAWLYAKDLIDRDGIAALESDEDNVAIPVQGDADPSKAIAPVPAVITPPEFFDQSAMIANDIDRVSGVSDYQRGAQTQIKRTATEAAMIQDAANARAQDRLAKVEDILAQIGERIIALMQQYMTGEKVARITSIPAQAWVTYTNEFIAGKFDFAVAAGSTEPQNETFRRQSALQLVDASMPFLEMGVANPHALYQHVLSKGFGIQDTTKFVQPPPGPPPDIPQVGAPPPQGAMPPGLPPGPPPGMPPAPPDAGAIGLPDMGMGAQMGAMPPDIDPAMLEMMLAGGGGLPPG